VSTGCRKIQNADVDFYNTFAVRMKIKALCTDIDGTLLDSNRELSARTIAVFQRIPKSVPIILASSRMPSAMTHLQRELGIVDHPLICYNGGFGVHYKTSANVFSNVSIPVSVCMAILEMTRGTSIHTSLYHEDHWHAPALDYWTDREQRITKANAVIEDGFSVLRRWTKEDRGAHKVMCMGPEEEITTLEITLHKSLSNEIHIYRSRPTYLELAPRSISKATALELILKSEFGIKMSEVMAFGDNYNDIELIQSVGFGVAVANARDEVKAVAKEITAKSVEDGVAMVIEKHFQFK
jgi:Cof subfamily protein (haloacid dehalogenase superfamily)